MHKRKYGFLRGSVTIICSEPRFVVIFFLCTVYVQIVSDLYICFRGKIILKGKSRFHVEVVLFNSVVVSMYIMGNGLVLQ